MIPAVPGAALVGLLLTLLAALLAVVLLGWWGWRLWHAGRGRPRPALRLWQWVLAILLSVVPVSTLVGLAQMGWNDWRQDRQIAEQERLMHITLSRPVVWGDITLPAGSHVLRDLPEGDVERADGQPDLRALQDIRFPVPVEVGGLWVNALSLTGQLVLELARPHRFVAHEGQPAQDCAAGDMVQFNARKERGLFVIPKKAQMLTLAEWVFDTCFQAQPIALRYWKGGRLVWADTPAYEQP